MNRFFVFQKQDNYFILNNNTLKHLKVIRATNQTFICVYNQKFYECILEDNKAKIIKEIHINNERNYEVILCAALIKFERFEWLIQKATELGVTKIIPMITEYTNGEFYKHQKFEKKIERLKTILQNAAEQSFRNKIPELEALSKYEDLVKTNISQKYIAHEKISDNNAFNFNQKDIMFFICTEGGFSEKEIQKAIENNCQIISLYIRILRSETAGIFLLSNLKID